MRVLVTGSRGFVGTTVAAHLTSQGHHVVRATRGPTETSIGVGDIGPETDWTAALSGVDCVVHLAGHVHRPSEHDSSNFVRVNVHGTRRLAEQAASSTVSRFVFLSTVGIVGASHDGVVNETTESAPMNSYAQSKLDAEARLLDIARESELEAVVLRAPLVYGPGSPGNLQRLRRVVERGVPIPFRSIRNQRSAISIDNLASGIGSALESDSVANEVFYIEDGTVWSTREMVEQVALSIGRSPKMVPVPGWAIRSGLKLSGQGELTDRLLGSLVVDGSAFRARSGWVPPLDVSQALSLGVI